jgi:hypothetical protein
MSPRDKPLVWLSGEIKTPPFGPEARFEAGFLLRRLQTRRVVRAAPLAADADDRVRVP